MARKATAAPTPHTEGHRVTIHDVARELGVSTATVSLALSNSTVVAEATRERVREMARRLNYSPSAVGRALQAKKTNAVGLVVPHSGQHVFGHLYFMEVLSGVIEVVNQADMTLVLSTASTEDEEGEAYLKILQSQQVDGIVLASAALYDANIARLKQSGRPFVFIGRYPLDRALPAVGIDDHGGARQAARHLLDHGHRRIAHISGPLQHLSAIDRFNGYKAELEQAGIPPNPDYLFEGDYTEAAGRAGMQALLALSEPPTALFAGNDEAAVGAMAVLRQAGISPGRDFPVVGFDDVLLARHVTPALTTVWQPMRQLGVEAAQLLLNLIQGNSPAQSQTELGTKLVIRQSCGCLPD
jgi:DNA-binding LacI/PurR family transcriptional regulator